MAFKRYEICKYSSSGKFIAVERIGNKKLMILELNDKLTNINKMKFQNHIKSGSIQKTDYLLEVEEKQNEHNDGKIEYSVTYLRVIKSTDILLDNWHPNKSLEELPIGAYLHITKEEKYWAGEEKGNIIGNIISLICIIVFLILSFKYGWGMLVFSAIASLMVDWNYKTWKRDKQADARKLEELLKYKNDLIKNRIDRLNQTKSSFEKQLENYNTWESLSPEEFEFAVATWLNQKGYDLKVTQYSGDGGIDLSGKDKNKIPTIVQVKKYAKNVGVAVVREMIGVRQNHTDNPNTMIVSLVGFTRGAKELATSEGIILVNIKEEFY